MNWYYFTASSLCFILGIAHSVIGEMLIFKNYRNKGNIIPIKSKEIRERHLRIIWATWHLASILGCGFGFILYKIAKYKEIYYMKFTNEVILIIIISFISSSLLIFYATKGKHPGWFIFMLIAILLWIG